MLATCFTEDWLKIQKTIAVEHQKPKASFLALGNTRTIRFTNATTCAETDVACTDAPGRQQLGICMENVIN